MASAICLERGRQEPLHGLDLGLGDLGHGGKTIRREFDWTHRNGLGFQGTGMERDAPGTGNALLGREAPTGIAPKSVPHKSRIRGETIF
jgi:hypothetical protein